MKTMVCTGGAYNNNDIDNIKCYVITFRLTNSNIKINCEK